MSSLSDATVAAVPDGGVILTAGSYTAALRCGQFATVMLLVSTLWLGSNVYCDSTMFTIVRL
jgi:hypothetical protein